MELLGTLHFIHYLLHPHVTSICVCQSIRTSVAISFSTSWTCANLTLHNRCRRLLFS